MQLFYSTGFPDLIRNKYLFLDNDFLSALFKDIGVFTQFYSLTDSAYLQLDSLTIFEFLRDYFVPTEVAAREKFISHSIFIPATDHQSVYLKVRENAMLLSKIYAHKRVSGNTKQKAPGLVDLFLAAKLMLYADQGHLLITGNKKDYPSKIFDTISVINIENEVTGNLQGYSLLRFNKDKFLSCYEDLQRMKKTQRL